MAGKPPVKANAEQKAQLEDLATSRDRGEADRARAILLTLDGWTSTAIAEVFRVREDTVRFWRGAFLRGGVEAVKARVYAGPSPVKTEAALRVVTPLLEVRLPIVPTGRLRDRSPRSKPESASRSAGRSCPRPCEKSSGGGGPGTR